MTSSTAVQPDAVQRARELAPAIAARALEAERLRRMPDETIAELSRSGLFSLMAPRRYGGDEASLETLVGAVIEVGKVCGSTAWTFCIYGIHNWLAGLFPEQLQDEMFGSVPMRLSLAVSGQLVALGYRHPGRGRLQDNGALAIRQWCLALVVGVRRGSRPTRGAAEVSGPAYLHDPQV